MKRHLRVCGAIVGLCLLAWLVVTYRPSGVPVGREPTRVAVLALLVPLLAAAVGILRRASWGTDTGLAAGLAVLPWATVLTLTPSFGAPIMRQVVALVGAALLLLTLLSGTPGDERQVDGALQPAIDGLRWIRWCLVLNLSAGLNLYAFLIAYSFGATWQPLVLAALFVGVLSGTGLLARNVTGGLILLAVSAVLMVPSAVLFVGAEARSLGEVLLFAFLFVPAVFAALGTTAVFGKSLVGLFRELA